MSTIEIRYLPTFDRKLKKLNLNEKIIKDLIYKELQHYVDENPESYYFPDSGAGIGNIWKLRVKGRGGFRAIYFAVPQTRHFDFITIYPKNKQANLTNDQIKIISKIIKRLER